MNKSTIIGLVVVLLVIVGGIMWAARNDEPVVMLTPTVSASPSMSVSPSVSPSASATASSSPKPATVTILYTDSGFEPANVTIVKGSTVIWKNNSSRDMWPASALHPTHKVYPEQNSCFAGVFTGCRVAPGATYSMKFNLVGAWAYHDHVDSTHFGKVTVINQIGENPSE